MFKYIYHLRQKGNRKKPEILKKMPTFTFKRGERLRSRRLIGQLFRQGQSLGQYPLRLIWTTVDDRLSPYPVQFALSVPKKKFPKAVSRNRLRRLIREAYRLNKHLLYQALENEKRQLALMVIYTGSGAFPFEEIESAMQQLIRRFLRKWKNGRNTFS